MPDFGCRIPDTAGAWCLLSWQTPAVTPPGTSTDPGWRPVPVGRWALRLLRPPAVRYCSCCAQRSSFCPLPRSSLPSRWSFSVVDRASSRIEEVTAQIVLFAAVGLAAAVIAMSSREPPDDRSAGHLRCGHFGSPCVDHLPLPPSAPSWPDPVVVRGRRLVGHLRGRHFDPAHAG